MSLQAFKFISPGLTLLLEKLPHSDLLYMNTIKIKVEIRKIIYRRLWNVLKVRKRMSVRLSV